MSAMENMLGSMLAKMMPPELLAALSPENLQRYSEEARALITDFQTRLTNIEQMLMQNNDLLNALLERANNDGCKYTGGKRPGSVKLDVGE